MVRNEGNATPSALQPCACHHSCNSMVGWHALCFVMQVFEEAVTGQPGIPAFSVQVRRKVMLLAGGMLLANPTELLCHQCAQDIAAQFGMPHFDLVKIGACRGFGALPGSRTSSQQAAAAE